jgi:hypothetical protein
LEYRCVNCHGWKEKEYHPNNYKISECDSENGCRKKHCPYYHFESEKRSPPTHLKLFPRNRGTSIGLTHQYIGEYLRIMFSNPERVNTIAPHRKSNQAYYPEQ